ncbi:hypothetical protein ABIF96_005793 [Bradyrhizobium ottawaense]|uniref:hypothetical protein n=1 Tax=Bradyrhizobium ottawaense TaxID=931866 RepID=UPI003836179C
MTVFYAPEIAKLISGSGTVGTPAQGFTDGTVRAQTAVVTMATQTTSDTIVVGVLPKGSIFLYGVLNNSATLGSSTVAIGITGTTGKYRAAATKTSTTPEVIGVGGNHGVALSAAETVFITIGAASLPSSGTLSVSLFYAEN